MKLINEKKIYDGKIINLYNKEYNHNGKTYTREIIEHQGGACILPVKNNKIYFVKQYRNAIENDLLELPAGCIEKNEEPLNTARRELQEEIGYDCENLKLLLKFHPTPGYSNEVIYIYLAENLIPHQLEPDDDEFLEVMPIDIPTIKALLKDNYFTDAKTLIGLLTYFNMKK